MRRKGGRRLIGIGVLVGTAIVPVLVAVPSARALPVDNVSLSLSRVNIDAGSSETVIATVTADLGTYPANNVQAAFSSSGDVHFVSSACNTNSSGQCSVAIQPGTTYGNQTITVQVTGIGYAGSASKYLFQYAAP